jgi:hypothetical protein
MTKVAWSKKRDAITKVVPGAQEVARYVRRKSVSCGVCESVRIRSSLACAAARYWPASVRRIRVSSHQTQHFGKLEGLAVAIPWGSESPLPHHLSCVHAMFCRTRYVELSINRRSPFRIFSTSKPIASFSRFPCRGFWGLGHATSCQGVNCAAASRRAPYTIARSEPAVSPNACLAPVPALRG